MTPLGPVDPNDLDVEDWGVSSMYHRLHPPMQTDTTTQQPVLKVTLQPDARPKGIAADLVFALGDPAWGSGTVQTLTNRAGRRGEEPLIEVT